MGIPKTSVNKQLDSFFFDLGCRFVRKEKLDLNVMAKVNKLALDNKIPRSELAGRWRYICRSLFPVSWQEGLLEEGLEALIIEMMSWENWPKRSHLDEIASD